MVAYARKHVTADLLSAYEMQRERSRITRVPLRGQDPASLNRAGGARFSRGQR